MIQDVVHDQICKNFSKVEKWFEEKSSSLQKPVYASFDIRDSGFKVAPVDANIFPAGFNNICDIDRENAGQKLKQYLDSNYANLSDTIAILTEEHTNNPYYWENVSAIIEMIKAAGYDCKVTFAKNDFSSFQVASVTDKKISIHPSIVNNSELWIDDQKAGLIICNNDFSVDLRDWRKQFSTPMNPPAELGWYQRRKNTFFELYNQLVKEFSEIIQMDAKLLQVETVLFKNFDVGSEDSLNELANEVDKFIASIKVQYKLLKIDSEPYVFVKNNSGTYGLGVIRVASGQEVREWNYKSRKKMKAVKGGGKISEVIIQEGISTRYFAEGISAEPTIYTIGDSLAGGFLRTHSQKGPEENLNSPGAVFKKLCVSDLKVNTLKCPMENVYGWLAKIGVLSIALEAEQSKIKII